MVPLSADNQANLENNQVRIRNNREWSEEQNQHRIVEIDHQERKKGSNSMKQNRGFRIFRIKEGRHNFWLTMQGDSRKKDGKIYQSEWEGSMTEQATPENNSKKLNWTTEMKMDVAMMEKEERAKERGFMMSVKNDGIKSIQNTNKLAGRN